VRYFTRRRFNVPHVPCHVVVDDDETTMAHAVIELIFLCDLLKARKIVGYDKLFLHSTGFCDEIINFYEWPNCEKTLK
jgi:hypothetical protein